jgi:hypothetical protein
VRWQRFAAGPCLLAVLDRVTARGVGDQVSSHTRHAAVFAAGAGAIARWQSRPSFALILLLGAQLQLSRPRIVLDGLGEVDQLAPLAFSASTGLEWSL